MQYPDYILLVDDDQTTNYLNKATLERAQIAKNVFCVGNGEDAFSKIHEIEANDNSDVKNLWVLLDLDMPILSGYEFLEELKMSRVNLKIEVYVLSILSEFREKENLSSYPIAGYIEKPLCSQAIEKLVCHNEPFYFNQAWQKTERTS
jgi:CheY-like chemotaxis protein